MTTTTENTTYVPLLPQIIQKHWLCTIAKRTADFAIVHRTKGELEHWEVWQIQKHKAHTWPNGDFTPAHESPPAENSWGSHGWTFQTQAQAEAKFEALVNAPKAK